MKIETFHTRPAPQQANPEAETLPMPVAGNDVGHGPSHVDDAMYAKAPSNMHRTWDKERSAMSSLPGRARQAKAQGEHYVAQEPVKAAMMAAAGGAALAMILRAAARRGRH
jgi:ElaB/YqjD/DUF883 family membrane-anchored ribosome-binding protein